jgi:hypothetical protein
MANGKKNRGQNPRHFLAMTVTLASVAVVLLLAGLSIFKDGTKAGDVLAIVLPLLGTWVGTVLAYYFSRDNFEAASRSVEKMVSHVTAAETLAATLARTKMIQNDPQKLFSAKEPLDKIVLKDVMTELTRSKRGNRVPVFDAGGKLARLVVHRSLIERFLAGQALAGKTKAELEALSMADLLKDPELAKYAKAFVVVDESASLAKVKELMEALEHCQDAFVTRGGKPTDEVLGWITNVIIEENSKV